MLTKLHIKGFKSLRDLSIEFPRLTVLFGPNASGKSNIIEAAQLLSQMGTSWTLADAFDGPVRGYPLEAFTFPCDGLPGLLRQQVVQASIEGELDDANGKLRYRIGVQASPRSGALAVFDEYLARLNSRGDPKHNPVIEVVGKKLFVRRKGKPSRPREEPLGLNYALLSDRRLGGRDYEAIEQCRAEFEGWRVYYLDPRTAMRLARPPAEVSDIGVVGQDIGPYLYRLKAEDTKRFEAVRRTLRSLVPAVEGLEVDLDEARGTLDIQVAQDGCSYSSRIISEGTLRVLALCSIAVNPWARGLVAFEEPENGVHPRRLELIAQLLVSLALDQGRQVIVTTHSALFCSAVLRLTRERRADAQLLAVRKEGAGTRVAPIEYPDGIFEDDELRSSLTSPTEDGLFEAMLLRGWLDE